MASLFRPARLAVALCAAPIGVGGLAAQRPAAPPPAPGSPAACIADATVWRSAQTAPALDAYRKATDANRAELLSAYSAASGKATLASQEHAAACATKFDWQVMPAEQLPELIALYEFARDTVATRRATERLLNAPDLPPRARGEALMLGMRQEVAKQSGYFGILDAAEQFVAKIDQLPDLLADIKLAAHQRMLGTYEYLDVADGLRDHATAMIALGKQLNQPNAMISGYSSLARSYADRLHPDSALMVLDRAEKELGAPATARFKDFRQRYALIGTRAPEIQAEWWINTDQPSVRTPRVGRVTLVEFTAHWCGPCKNSYPGISGLAKRFEGRGFDGVMVTSLYGYLGTQRDLTPAQEIEADKIYFGKEHALPFPVAINPPVKQVAGQGYHQPKPDEDYRVGGIPQIIIVDKQGIIRQIVTGWDQGNTERFSALIEKLLAEP